MKQRGLEMNQVGFTLVEVLIATGILAFISVFTAQMISGGIKARAKVERQIGRESALRDALQVMSRDINVAFNYRDINTEVYNAAQTERKNRGQQGQNQQGDNQQDDGNAPTPTPTPPPLADNNGDEDKYALKEIKPFSFFIGEKEKLNFSSLANVRAVKNSSQSDQAEIGYSIHTCRARLADTSSDCLWRRVAPFIDDKFTEGGKESVLIENVKSLQFRYLGPDSEEEWIETWKSDGTAAQTTKGKFPYAVEITLSILDTTVSPAKEVTMTAVAPLKFPNNKPEEKSAPVN